MITLPQITMVGTLTAAPELRYTNSGKPYATFTVVANDRTYNKDTKQYEDGGATFIRGTIWNDTAENVAESLDKGNRVIVVGTLKQNDWTDKEGHKRSTLQMNVDEVGPSLKWATAKPVKAGAKAAVSSGDAWGGSSDEPDW